MLIEPQPTTFLQIFCEFMIKSEVIFKSIKVPDDFCQGGLQAYVGLTISVIFCLGFLHTKTSQVPAGSLSFQKTSFYNVNTVPTVPYYNHIWSKAYHTIYGARHTVSYHIWSKTYHIIPYMVQGITYHYLLSVTNSSQDRSTEI